MIAMALSILAVVASIVLGNIKKVNMGVFAAMFTILIGCFLLKMGIGEVLVLLPVRVLFTIFVITAFLDSCLRMVRWIIW